MDVGNQFQIGNRFAELFASNNPITPSANIQQSKQFKQNPKHNTSQPDARRRNKNANNTIQAPDQQQIPEQSDDSLAVTVLCGLMEIDHKNRIKNRLGFFHFQAPLLLVSRAMAIPKMANSVVTIQLFFPTSGKYWQSFTQFCQQFEPRCILAFLASC